MKKHFLFSGLIILLAPTIAYASWWNPFSWKIFSDISGTNTSVINAKVKLSSEILTCNGEKWNQCPEGQRFVCPENNQSDAYCETVSNVVKSPVNRCEEFKQKYAVLIQDHKTWMKLINETRVSIMDEYRIIQQNQNKPSSIDKLTALRSQQAHERATRTGMYAFDENTADSFYREQIAKYSAQATRDLALPNKLEQLNKEMSEVLDQQSKLNLDTKRAVEKLQAEYPKCPVS